MKISVVGMGPGSEKKMTLEAMDALEECDAIAGYSVYVNLIKDRFPGKEIITTPMRREEERCRLAVEAALSGKHVVMVSSGDAGVYGMAALIYEVAQDYDPIEIQVVPGVTAACSGAALLGAPLTQDFAVISLSDLLTPWEKIEKRLSFAAQADFVLCLYNPASHLRPDYLPVSYTHLFMPYTLVKDHRTNYESGNINAVMDGDLDGFINAYLKAKSLGQID